MTNEYICDKDIKFLLAEISDNEGGLTAVESDGNECINVSKYFYRIL